MEKFVSADNIEACIPKTLEILVHFPSSPELRQKGLYIALALQYNISAYGTSTMNAVEELVPLVAYHCAEALKERIDPVNMASKWNMDAYMLGDPVPDILFADVNVKVTKEVAQRIAPLGLFVHSVCERQQIFGIYDLEKLLKT